MPTWREVSADAGKPKYRHERPNLLDGTAAFLGDSQTLDADIGAIVSPSPYVGKTTRGDRVGIGPEGITRDSIRGRKGRVVAADGLEFVQTSSINIIGYWNDIESLQRQVENLTRSRRESAHSVKEIHQPN